MSSFFSTPASQRKRKRQDNPSSAGPRPSKKQQPTRRAQQDDDESISGSDSEDDIAAPASASASSSADEDDGSGDDDQETSAAARRLKLAERYLENVRSDAAASRGAGEDGVGFDAAEIDAELIAARLREDVAEEKGRVYRRIADSLDLPSAQRSVFRADTLSVTGVAVSAPFAYTVSKDMALCKWQLVAPAWTRALAHLGKKGKNGKIGGMGPPPRRKKPKQVAFTKGSTKHSKDPKYRHHTAPILCVAASADGKFVATGGEDKRMIVWDAKTLKPLKVFTQHRDAVTSLAFRGKTNQLFSASRDRTVKIWSLNELAYVETLFGHQDQVMDVAAVGGKEERCISVGGRDRSARLWKVVEESQLVFRGGGDGGPRGSKKRGTAADGASTNGDKTLGEQEEKDVPRFTEGSVDRVIQIDSHLFVTGSDNGALSLYGLHKKKAMHIYPSAHGYDPPIPVEQSSVEADLSGRKTQALPTPRWITALASVPFSDLFVSGSWDGCVRLWKISEDQKRIESVGIIGQSPDVPDGVDAVEGAAAGLRGVVNDLAVFERGERGQDGACIVAAVGTDCRLGRWVCKPRGKNCAVVIEIPKLRATANGTVA